MDINEFLYNNELLGEADEYDIEFINLCFKNSDAARKIIEIELEEHKRILSDIRDEISEFTALQEVLIPEIKKEMADFTGKLVVDSFWSNELTEEKRKELLRGYYEHISAVFSAKDRLYHRLNIEEIELAEAGELELRKKEKLYSLVIGDVSLSREIEEMNVEIEREKLTSQLDFICNLAEKIEVYAAKMSLLSDAASKGENMKVSDMRALVNSFASTL